MGSENLINELISKKILITGKNCLKLFNQIDMSMYGAKSWAWTLQRIGDKKGSDYLFNLGLLMGKDSAQELKEVIDKIKNYLPSKMQVITNLVEMAGFGVINIKEDSINSKIVLEIESNHIIDSGITQFKDKSLICHFYAGLYSGFVEGFLDFKDFKFIEKECKSKGKSKCIFNYQNV